MAVREGSEELGTWLGRQLRRADMTQAQLAEKLGVTRAAVSAWTTGRARPREEMIHAIAKALGTDVATMHDRTSDVVRQLPIRWYHREAHKDGGREFGNAAAFAFDADLGVLAREVTQNSLDERVDQSRPVRMRFVLHELTGEHLERFLGALQWERLLPHYTAAASSDQKVGRALASALQELQTRKSLVLLRVDDYNAAGLTGPEYDDGRYAAVVRRQLDSHKRADGRAGGSYGLGKATLWATSRLGLVLINSTLSVPHEGRTIGRLVGRLDLPWREVDGSAFAGPAWFGEPDSAPDYVGVSRSWWGDDATAEALHLRREGTEAGTSFLVVGAYDASGDAEELPEMHTKLVTELARNFWATMTGSRSEAPMLDASVTTLRNGTVLFEEQRVDPAKYHPAATRALRAFLDGETVGELTAGDQVAQAEVTLVVPWLRADGAKPGKGLEHRAVLLLTPTGGDDSRPNRVTSMRGGRMTVESRRPTDLPLGADPYQAVLLAGYATGRDSEEVRRAEAFLRASEPPEHDRWDKTEEVAALYVRGAQQRLKDFRVDTDTAVRRLLGRREVRGDNGPAVLRDRLRLDGVAGYGPRIEGHPTVRYLTGELDPSGAWRVRAEMKIPQRDDPWVLVPVAKFDVRSGSRPTVEWAELTAAENCEVVDGALRIEPGARSASFTGVTAVASHPVSSSLTRLIVDLRRTKGDS